MCLNVVIDLRFQTIGLSAHSKQSRGEWEQQLPSAQGKGKPNDTVCEIVDGLASFKSDVGMHVGLPMSKCMHLHLHALFSTSFFVNCATNIFVSLLQRDYHIVRF